MTDPPFHFTRSLSVNETANRLGISRASLYDFGNVRSSRFDPDLPRPFKIRTRTFFVEAEIEQYLQTKIAASRCGKLM